MEPKKNHYSNSSPWGIFSKRINDYKTPSISKSIWQIVNTLVPYIGVWILIVYSLSISYILTAFLIILAAGFLVRLFIIFHDCGHGSFFKSDLANKVVGVFCGILAFTPYDRWHNQHLRHHATVGNLDKRGIGDVWTMTREEYQLSTPWTQFKYRLYRNPFTMFGIGSWYIFIIQNRFTKKSYTNKEKWNIIFTNLVLLVIAVGMGFAIGFVEFLVIQFFIIYIAAVAGFWLFYLQHQYEDVSWYRTKDWNFTTVALNGSSFVKFPRILQWFSGNIGFHHIHHLNALIPNYNLEKCYRENPVLQEIKPVTFIKSLKTLKLRLWDEELHKLVSFNG